MGAERASSDHDTRAAPISSATVVRVLSNNDDAVIWWAPVATAPSSGSSPEGGRFESCPRHQRGGPDSKEFWAKRSGAPIRRPTETAAVSNSCQTPAIAASRPRTSRPVGRRQHRDQAPYTGHLATGRMGSGRNWTDTRGKRNLFTEFAWARHIRRNHHRYHIFGSPRLVD